MIRGAADCSLVTKRPLGSFRENHLAIGIHDRYRRVVKRGSEADVERSRQARLVLRVDTGQAGIRRVCRNLDPFGDAYALHDVGMTRIVANQIE